MTAQQSRDMERFSAPMHQMPHEHDIVCIDGLQGDWMVVHAMMDPLSLGGFGIWQGELVQVFGERELILSQRKETVLILCDESLRNGRDVRQVLQADVRIVARAKVVSVYFRNDP